MAKQKELDEVTIQILDGLLQKTRSLGNHIDTQTNILVGVSTAIFLFSLSRTLGGEQGILFLILSVFSGISSLVSLLAVHPPTYMRKKGQEETLLYNKTIAQFASSKKYGKELEKIIDNRKVIIEEYATEIYNMSKYYYRPKRKLFHISRNILITGIFFTLLTFVIEMI
jgi:hypothetical protein